MIFFLTETIHAQFSVVFRQWKEANVKIHGYVTFRTGLKAQGTKTIAKKSKKLAAKASEKEKEPMPKLTTQVYADNRKKRRELLDGRQKSKKLRSL